MIRFGDRSKESQLCTVMTNVRNVPPASRMHILIITSVLFCRKPKLSLRYVSDKTPLAKTRYRSSPIAISEGLSNSACRVSGETVRCSDGTRKEWRSETEVDQFQIAILFAYHHCIVLFRPTLGMLSCLIPQIWQFGMNGNEFSNSQCEAI